MRAFAAFGDKDRYGPKAELVNYGREADFCCGALVERRMSKQHRNLARPDAESAWVNLRF